MLEMPEARAQVPEVVGGTAGAAGEAGAGGSAGAAGSAGPCAACGPLEDCWNGQLCVVKGILLDSGVLHRCDGSDEESSTLPG